MNLASICVYCASSPGTDPRFSTATAAFGRLIGSRGLTLVYGGGHVGLMGVLADEVLQAGGEVHGVITRALEEKEVAHTGLTRLDVVDTMHQRKSLMADRADGFAMLPGGFGTLDEFFEAVTWTQLGVHTKPCGILNVNGYFDPIRDFLDAATEQRLIRRQHRDLVIIESDPEALLEQLAAWEPVDLDKWLDRTDR